MFNMNDLWTCPICKGTHSEPVVTCRRCECQLLLLNKIKIEALTFLQKGCDNQAGALYRVNFTEPR